LKAAFVVAAATLRQIARHRIALLLFFVLPPLFVVVVVLTGSDQSFPFAVPAVDTKATLFATARDVTLLFVAIAGAGLFSTFAALSSMQLNRAADRRLALMGMAPAAIAVGRSLALLFVSVAAGCFVAALVLPLLPSARALPVVLALVLGGLVYGAFGLVVGAVLDGPLEGVLVVALLVQLDAGWLQNPSYYYDASRTAILHALPAYFPSQAALTAAFGGPSAMRPLALAAAYAGLFFTLAIPVVLFRLPRPPSRAA
jgi:hypothetical protein